MISDLKDSWTLTGENGSRIALYPIFILYTRTCDIRTSSTAASVNRKKPSSQSEYPPSVEDDSFRTALKVWKGDLIRDESSWRTKGFDFFNPYSSEHPIATLALPLMHHHSDKFCTTVL